MLNAVLFPRNALLVQFKLCILRDVENFLKLFVDCVTFRLEFNHVRIFLNKITEGM